MADFKIEKITVGARSRKLAAKWVIEEVQNATPFNSSFIPMPRKIEWMFVEMNEIRPNANSAHPFGLNGLNVDTNSFMIMQQFCREHFGPSERDDARRRWVCASGGAEGLSVYFGFNTEADRTMFYMRFSDGC